MAKYHDGAVSGSRRVVNVLLTVLLAALCVVWLYPVLLILINSLKDELAISTATVFELPTQATFAGLHNYTYGITQLNFLQSFGYSATITITSVVLILLCCSMCGWYITRVSSMISKAMYLLCVFSMVVPFQMVMFTLSKTADTLKLNTPWTIPVIYLGFGAGLAVFMFTGFVKAIPLDIEEAAAIDGCGPIRTFFQVSFPMAMPGIMVATLYTFLGSMEEAQGTLLVGLARIKTMPVEMYGIILDYPGQAGAVFAILLMIPAAVMILAMKKYIGPEAIAGGFKMK